jgi:hypothetical protein
MHAKFKPLNNAERKTVTALYIEAFYALQLLAGIRQHTSAYVSIRQHTSAYVSIRQHLIEP